MRVVLLAWLATVIAGCAPQHVYIPPLPTNLTPEQRVVAFQAWQRRGYNVERSTHCRGLLHGCTSDVQHTLMLDRGVVVTEGDDLLPLLHPASSAGKAAADIVRRRKHQRFWTWFAVSTIIAGAVVAGVGTQVEQDQKIPVLGIVGAGVIGLGFTTGYVLHRYHSKQIKHASGLVFTGYDEALAQRLGLCVSGIVLVPCELGTPGAIP